MIMSRSVVLVFFLLFSFLLFCIFGFLIVVKYRGVFVFGLCSAFLGICNFYICLGCWGFFGWGCLGGIHTFLFEKLHAQFAVLQIARTRA